MSEGLHVVVGGELRGSRAHKVVYSKHVNCSVYMAFLPNRQTCIFILEARNEVGHFRFSADLLQSPIQITTEVVGYDRMRVGLQHDEGIIAISPKATW
jgi:hypothetical protein